MLLLLPFVGASKWEVTAGNERVQVDDLSHGGLLARGGALAEGLAVDFHHHAASNLHRNRSGQSAYTHTHPHPSLDSLAAVSVWLTLDVVIVIDRRYARQLMPHMFFVVCVKQRCESAN